jgi:hypothetical protein
MTGSLTLEAWIYPRDIFSMFHGTGLPGQSNQGQVILRKDGSYILYFWCESGESGMEGTGALDLFLYGVGSTIRVGCPIAQFQEDRWQHVVATYDGSEARIYLNGELRSYQSFNSGIASSAADLVIGATSSGDRFFFNGAIDEVSVLDRALTAEEVSARYGGKNVEVDDVDGDGFELVTLDGLGSYDLDGSVVSYEWEESGTLLGTAEIISNSFSVGTHSVTLTVTDNDEATSTDVLTVTVQSSGTPSGPKMHVESITIDLSKKGRNWQAIANLTICDNSGGPVGEATVTGDWTLNGSFLNTASSSTNGEGVARFESDKIRAAAGDVFTLTVTDVAKSGYTYDHPSEPPSASSDPVPSSKPATVTANGLGDNYPNPANPETQIGYSILNSGPITLRIYNTLGQVVRTLADDIKATGTYTVCWDGNDDRGVEAASGIYLYLLQAGTYVESKRMVLVR